MLKELGTLVRSFGKAGGSGLGLYHAKSSVESWGGTLSIQSKVGEGTSIQITLKTGSTHTDTNLEISESELVT